MAMSEPSHLDRLTLGYVAFAALVTAVRWPTSAGAPSVLLLYAGVALLALAAPALRRRGGVPAFFGEFYPLILTVLLYSAIGTLNSAVGVLHDLRVQAVERALFGCQPSVEWIRAMPSPVLSTLMHGAYLLYFAILAVGPMGLWFSGRREEARRVLLSCATAFYFCYAVFLLFPVAGPRYLFPLAENDATTIGIARFTQALLSGGSALGTAFPSSHVAASAAVSVRTFLEWKPLGTPLLAVSILLALATVYCQLHYAVDAVAGAAVAVIVLLVLQYFVFRTSALTTGSRRSAY
jgi:membrane-associated phospholipid phosphatase